MPLVRIRQDVAAAVIWNGVPTPLVPGRAYEQDDPFVRAHAWAFDLGESPVEMATALPGEKRATRRPGRPPKVQPVQVEDAEA